MVACSDDRLVFLKLHISHAQDAVAESREARLLANSPLLILDSYLTCQLLILFKVPVAQSGVGGDLWSWDLLNICR